MHYLYGLHLRTGKKITFEGSSDDNIETVLTVENPTGSYDKVITLPDANGTVLTTGNADVGTTTTSSSDADHVLIADGTVLKKITPADLGIGGGGGGSGVTVQDEGSALSTTATTLNFVGAGVTASGTGATKTVTISGGGGGGGITTGKAIAMAMVFG